MPNAAPALETAGGDASHIPPDREVAVGRSTYGSVGPAWGVLAREDVAPDDDEWVPLGDLTRESLEDIGHELLDELFRLRAEVRQVRADADRWREFTRRVNDGEQAAMAALAVMLKSTRDVAPTPATETPEGQQE